MINILSFFRQKRNKTFLVLILILSIFNCYTYYKNVETDKSLMNDDNMYLIVNPNIFNTIIKKVKSYEEYDLSQLESHGIKKEYDNYYKVTFNRISLYEKYRQKATFTSLSNTFTETFNNYKFYHNTVLILIGLSLVIFIIILICIVYYEKNNIILLKLIGYKNKIVFEIYFLNILILLLPSILVYVITLLLL